LLIGVQAGALTENCNSLPIGIAATASLSNASNERMEYPVFQGYNFISLWSDK
jgi:hypothetical protein